MTPQKVFETLNENQRRYLMDGLLNGERMRQEEGAKRIRASRCWPHHGRRHGTAPTQKKLASLKLVEPGFLGGLTSLGLKVARIAWMYDEVNRDDLQEPHARPVQTVEEFVKMQREETDREKIEREAQIKRAAHLWRSLKLADPHWETGSRAASSFIKKELEAYPDGSHHDSISLSVEDLISIGEGIEALR